MVLLSSFLPPLFRTATSGPALHIPDGFLSLPIALLCWIVSVGLLGLAVRLTRGQLSERQVPLMGVMAAFIFAAQMINFPVAGGTSGHLLGGALAAMTLGPWGGMLVMASVVGVQGLLFQDGGLVAMGANILNMGLLTALLGYGLYRGVVGQRRQVRMVVAGLAAWLSVMAGALATALELWLSGTARLDVVVPAMLSIHALIGIGEALITMAALAFIARMRPDLLEAEAGVARGGRGWVVAGLAVALAVVLLSPLASANPDGLQRVAVSLGFFHQGAPAQYTILPHYTLPFLGATPLSRIMAGAIGLLVVAGVAMGGVRLLRRSARLASKTGRQVPSR
ncbi:MAG: energy-coupling factor ABC transporter permease [Ardenticatenaceae bacterium]|nr:energy-coupling factor ABC transporter permease [Ardenticatenaceae bacterium]HBY96086.1 cobalamin biosynthesis protein CbiM [Chloroflexota bacterium]